MIPASVLIPRLLLQSVGSIAIPFYGFFSFSMLCTFVKDVLGHILTHRQAVAQSGQKLV